MIPGEYFLKPEAVICDDGKATAAIVVVNTGDRPVQVGSHFHFFEVNRQMSFERSKALGMRLNIAAGTAVRFEPGEEKKVELVELGGLKKVIGFNNLVNGITHGEPAASAALEKVLAGHFKTTNR
ncbi:MAG: urease subunit beta [Rhizobacter sp.]|nr:urease subunit beta [Ferruginibacter sp.]